MKDEYQKEISVLKTENKKIKHTMYQDDAYVQTKILNNIELLGNKARLQINLQANEAYKVLNVNDQFQKDLIC